MILVDTNVLSELTRAAPEPRVTAWLETNEPALALVHGMRIATRNVNDFEAAGVAIVNPWE